MKALQAAVENRRIGPSASNFVSRTRTTPELANEAARHVPDAQRELTFHSFDNASGFNPGSSVSVDQLYGRRRC